MAHDVPVIDVGRAGAVGLHESDPERTEALRDSALASRLALRVIAGPANGLSRKWLVRTENPYRAELEAVARAIGPRGVFVLNLVYEWGCSSSVGLDPNGPGMRLIRSVDWLIASIGRFSVIGLHDGPAGRFHSVTWPGFAGVVSGLAPGRFAAAVNQAPKPRLMGVESLDHLIARRWLLARRPGLPASHLLRGVFESASSYDDAVGQLMDDATPVTMPAMFVLCGTQPGEGSVIEAFGSHRRLHAVDRARGDRIAIANDWLSDDIKGWPPCYSSVSGEDPRTNNRHRRQQIADTQDLLRPSSAKLLEPLRNRYNIQFIVANPATGQMTVEALDRASAAHTNRSTKFPGVVMGPTELRAAV